MPSNLEHIRRAVSVLLESGSEDQQARARGLSVAVDLGAVLGSDCVRTDIARGLLLGAVREASGDDAWQPTPLQHDPGVTEWVAGPATRERQTLHGSEIEALTAALVAAVEET